MDNIWMEIFDGIRHPGVVTPKKRVVPQIFIEIERKRSTGKFEVPDRTRPVFGGSLAGSPDAQEGVPAPLREARQLAAGESDAIDFRKRICKERYARNLAHSGAE